MACGNGTTVASHPNGVTVTGRKPTLSPFASIALEIFLTNCCRAKLEHDQRMPPQRAGRIVVRICRTDNAPNDAALAAALYNSMMAIYRLH